MSKTKKVIAIAAILLTIAISFIGGQTYAKYTSQVVGLGVGKVADWSFKVNGVTDRINQIIDLASTANNETLVNNRIAPGTQGSFTIKVDGTGSDVGIKYELSSTAEFAKPANLKFIYNGTTYNTLTELFANAGGYIYADETNKVKDIKIDWEWLYETGTTDEEIAQNDELDTEAGMGDNLAFDVYVTATQIMPNA